MFNLTQLTEKQTARLAKLAKTDPLAKVIGWDMFYNGPLIRRSDDSLVVVTSGGQARSPVWWRKNG